MTASEHTTTLTLNGDGGYVWRCSCGDYYIASGQTYRVASAGAKRHRDRAKAKATP